MTKVKKHFWSSLFPTRAPRIFVSYRRRGDGAGYGGRIAEYIIRTFGPHECFRDVENIEYGVDFVTSIYEAVQASEIMILVIGPDWLTQTETDGSRRIDNPNDFVHIEVKSALERNIRVIPVLVGDAEMPNEEQLPEPLSGLSRRQAHELSDSRWEYDSNKLMDAIETIGINKINQKSRFSRWGVQLPKSALYIFGFLFILGVIVEISNSINHSPFNNVIPTPIVSETEVSASPELKPTVKKAAQTTPTEKRIKPKRKTHREVFSSGRWKIRWNLLSSDHIGDLNLDGNKGSFQVKVTDPLSGQQMTIKQDLEIRYKDQEVVLDGYNVREAVSGYPISHYLYAPDHIHLSLASDGSPTAEICSADHYLCTESEIIALR